MSLLEVRRGGVGRELEESGQRVQTSRTPPSRVRQPAQETRPSQPLPRTQIYKEPRSRHSLSRTMPAGPQAEAPSSARRARLRRQPGRPVFRSVLPSTELPEPCSPAADPSAPGDACCRKTPSATCNSSSNQPPSLPCPERLSPLISAETRRAVSPVSKLLNDIQPPVRFQNKHQERTEVKIHGDSQSLLSYLLSCVSFSSPLLLHPSLHRQEKYVLNSLVVWTSVGKPRPCWPHRGLRSVLPSLFSAISSPYTPAASQSPLRMLSWPKGIQGR